MSSLGDRIKALRARDSITQTQLGSEIGLTTSGVSSLEKGFSNNQETIKEIAKYFKVDVNWLLTGEGTPPKGVILKSISQGETDNPWKDAMILQMKEEINFYRELLRQQRTPQTGSFKSPLAVAGKTKVVKMYPALQQALQARG